MQYQRELNSLEIIQPASKHAPLHFSVRSNVEGPSAGILGGGNGSDGDGSADGVSRDKLLCVH